MAVFNRQNKAGTIGYAKFDMDNSQYQKCTIKVVSASSMYQTGKKKRKNKISQFEMHFTASSDNIRPYRNFNAVLHC